VGGALALPLQINSGKSEIIRALNFWLRLFYFTDHNNPMSKKVENHSEDLFFWRTHYTFGNILF